MPFTDTWNAAFEATPADSENINLGASRIRSLKVAVRERLEVDHVWEDGDNDGRHNKLTMPPQVAAPTTASPNGFLYAQTISLNTELLFKDSTGNIVQLTQAGSIFPFALGDFSVGQDLAVAQAATFGGTVSFATATVSNFAIFASGTSCVIQFEGTSHFIYDQSTNVLQLWVAGVLQQQWPP